MGLQGGMHRDRPVQDASRRADAKEVCCTVVTGWVSGEWSDIRNRAGVDRSPPCLAGAGATGYPSVANDSDHAAVRGQVDGGGRIQDDEAGAAGGDGRRGTGDIGREAGDARRDQPGDRRGRESPLSLLLVDHPFVSDHLRELIAARRLPIVLTAAARELGFGDAPHALTETEAVRGARAADRVRVYTSSENALPWIRRNLPFTRLPELASVFKDKARFRELLRSRYPDFFFRKVTLDALTETPADAIPFPVVIKPAVGFFSLGVVAVAGPEEWPAARRTIAERLRAARHLYPESVLDTASLIIEEQIEGEELAIDAYYDGEGDPVILGIWAHAFASREDTSDRVYTTSVEIVARHLDDVSDILADLGRLTGARDVPVHLEVRRTPEGRLVPIELNPLRFGGWCTTADLTPRAWGFSPYVHFLEERRPDWPALLRDADATRYSIVVLENSTGIDGREIAGFDYDDLVARFHRPLELRRVDYTRQPLFGFVFLATDPEHRDELDWILRADLSEFVTTRSDTEAAAGQAGPAPGT